MRQQLHAVSQVLPGTVGDAAVMVNQRQIVGGWPGLWPVVQHVWLGLIGIEGDLQLRQARFDDVLAAPTWNPRFLVYPGARNLPRVAVAAVEAEALLLSPSLRRLGSGPG